MSFKCNQDITLHLTDDLDQRLRARANAAGCGVSELLRDQICLLEHGCTFGELVANHRRAMLQKPAASAPHLRPSINPL